MFDHPRTRRAIRTERGAARNRAPDLRRGARASAPGARGLRRTRARHARARLRSEMAARRDPVDAQGPLPHHARLHAEKGPARARHDAAHLHRAGQPRLPVRGRHGEEVPRQPRAAAGRGGAVRQFAVCRGPALGLSSAIAAWCGPIPIPTAAAPCRLCSRTGFGFERYVDYMLDMPMYFVYRDGTLYRRERAVVPRFHRRQAAGAAGRNAADRRLGRPSDDGLSRGPAEDLSRNARRRWRPVAAAVRIAGAVGRPPLRLGGARRGL